MAALCDLTAVELAKGMRARELSPVELLDSCLERIAAVNPTLNAVVATDEPGARKAAEAAEAAFAAGEDPGPLAGLPLGIKDLNETRGLKTTYGSLMYSEFVPTADCGVVASLRAGGGSIFAKTNTPEFGAGANTTNKVYGVTGNPYDPALTCAGSSGGSAVALATSMLPLCNGSDLGGSLRTPAGYCGVVGLRPTPGTVPDETRVNAFSPLSVEGPMGRTVADCALLLSAMLKGNTGEALDPYAGRPADASLLGALPEVDPGRLKVAFTEDLGFAPVSQQVRGLFRQRRQAIGGLFAEAQDRDPELGEADRLFETLRGLNFVASYAKTYRSKPESLGPNVKANVELGLKLGAEELGWAAAEHSRLFHRFVGFMEQVDLLIAPTASVQPFDKTQLYPAEVDGRKLPTYIAWVAITYGLSLTGHPVLCLPCGLDENGLPFGLQIVGRRRQEGRLLAIGAALERAFRDIPGCAAPKPDLARLAAA
ncbi:Asp-tRNAAsn/Glu-tRNAGln amidotransferase A subunit [Tistlia consotensis]|uniref:Asp-tRNAAsn/Glu-tRNAGln amidotransferase A subunit n=1 Tax=Tistlia consotensis USBA 355 TaxID=560819 RepID=A0A1Y6BQY5_9PROT|nr:amidase family protein [Tistlia consotensis]SMF16527.1 Asp-tRNAAsn/Glu-tRNAGln amidotransferase A subunit [Tistlia consotensis USBA 355]SNR41071.1 Asp-tRNAAsn/Glu-tRNAGln amidotransferase A subunit [Tistlia consotensis]